VMTSSAAVSVAVGIFLNVWFNQFQKSPEYSEVFQETYFHLRIKNYFKNLQESRIFRSFKSTNSLQEDLENKKYREPEPNGSPNHNTSRIKM